MTTRIVAFQHSAMSVLLASLLAMGHASGSNTTSNSKNGTAKPAASNQAKPSTERHLVVVHETTTSSEDVGVFYEPLRCDSSGNVYFETDTYGSSGIHKLAPSGERLAVFTPGSNTEFKKIDSTGYFTVTDTGELYELAFPHELSRYVFVYKSDGSYKDAIKLETGFPWMPSSLAVFPSGTLLVSGLEYDSDQTSAMWPFTAIFSSDGTLLKQIKLKDDDTLRGLAAGGDTRVISPQNPRANHAIDFSKMEVGDGNVYVMRWINPAIFYAISAGGEVVRRFTVDPGDSGYHPVSMHVSQNRIAVLFVQSQTETSLVKVVDLEGHDVATYVTGGAQQKTDLLGTAFACYAVNPERFTFLISDDQNKLRVQIAEPK